MTLFILSDTFKSWPLHSHKNVTLVRISTHPITCMLSSSPSPSHSHSPSNVFFSISIFRSIHFLFLAFYPPFLDKIPLSSIFIIFFWCICDALKFGAQLSFLLFWFCLPLSFPKPHWDVCHVSWLITRGTPTHQLQ